MKFLLFGTGDYYNRYKKWFEQQEVLALLDNSVQKQHTVLDGIEVLPPEEGIRLDYDTIVILSFHVKQMRQQLVSLGVDESRIYHFYDLHQLLLRNVIRRPLQFCLNAQEIVEVKVMTGIKILLLSNELTLGGPPIALFHAALCLKKHGYTVIYASMLDGPLKERIIENDIPVIIDENLHLATMEETEWVDAFSLIVCNTLNFHVFLSERNTEIPVIWWLHDARFFYDGVNRKVIEKINQDNLKALSVGPVPAAAVKEFLPTMRCRELLYGVEDKGDIERSRNREIIRFITIGFLEDIKGQDILLTAVKGLPDSVRSRCQFCIVGHHQTLFGEKIQRESSDINEIIFTGSVSREAIHELLASSDVLICPSRQDSMPTVTAEAMMHAIPCIVSDAIGTAAYIHDGEDGFIFPSQNARMLAEKIEWCVANEEKLKGIGKKARGIYEKYFSMPVFEKRFLEIVQEALKQ